MEVLGVLLLLLMGTMLSLSSIKDIVKQRGMGVLIYGQSGTGKTSCVRGLNPKRGVIITTEPEGLAALVRFGWNEGNFEVVDTPEEFMSAVTKAVTADIDWVCLDTISAFYDLLFDDYMRINKLSPDAVSFKVYGHCSYYTKAMVMRALDCMVAGKAVILLCHQGYDKEEGAGMSALYTKPDVAGKLAEWISRKMTMVLRSNKVTRQGVETYVLSSPGGRDAGKDLTGQVEKPVPNDLAPLLTLSSPTKAQLTTIQKPEPVLVPVVQDAKPASIAVPAPIPAPILQKPAPAAPLEEKQAPEEKKKKVNLTIKPSPEAAEKISNKQLKYIMELALETATDTKGLQKLVKEKFGKKITELSCDELKELTLHFTAIIDATKKEQELPW